MSKDFVTDEIVNTIKDNLLSQQYNLSGISDYELIEILIRIPDSEFVKACSMNKRHRNICYDSVYTEQIFRERSQKFFDKKFLGLKENDMKWKDFYIAAYKIKKNEQTLYKLFKQLNLIEVKLIIKLLGSTPPKNFRRRDLADAAVKSNKYDILNYLQTLNILPTSYGANFACENGNLDMLKYLAQHNILPTYDGADYAYKNGNLEILKFLALYNIIPRFHLHTENKLELLKFYASLNPPHYADSTSAEIAARTGDFDLLKFIMDNNPKAVPEFITYRGSINRYKVINEDAVQNLFRNNYTKIIEYLIPFYVKNPDMLRTLLEYSAKYGELRLYEILYKYVREDNYLRSIWQRIRSSIYNILENDYSGAEEDRMPLVTFFRTKP